MASTKPTLLLEVIDRAYNERSWHGPNLAGAVRGIDAAMAGWRPSPERHSIQEQVVHAAYWKYVARRRLTGEKRGSFPLEGSNWFDRPESETTEATWRADLRLLRDMHDSLRAAVAKAKPSELTRVSGKDGLTNASLILGVAAHDVYHAGQIQLLARLAESKGVRASAAESKQRRKPAKAAEKAKRDKKASVAKTPSADVRPKLNREWHLANRMPPKATLDQRIAWHVEHRKHCGCREITGKLLEQMKARGLA